MTLKKTIPTALLLAFALGASPVRADERHDGGNRGRSEAVAHRGDVRHQENADVRRGNPVPVGAAGQAVPRAEVPARVEPRVVAPQVVAPRVEPRVIAPRVEPRVAPRVEPRVYGPPAYVAPARVYPHVYPRPVYVYPRPVYPRPVYVAPAWTWFRPHFHIGFGVYLGYPVAYPYPYPYAYPVPAPAYGYPAAPSVSVSPGTAYGGVSFQITPDDAAVYVDGNYVGTVGTFYDPEHPLTLAAGPHRIEIAADGYQTLTFDVNVQSGQVIPYQGALQAY
jgi:PEGA domain-containing protein